MTQMIVNKSHAYQYKHKLFKMTQMIQVEYEQEKKEYWRSS